MPWSGSGTFTRNYSWTNDAANSIPITASRMDADTNDIVTNGFGNTLTRDGQGSATANLPMNGFKHTNCANGVAATDYATMGQIAGFAPLASPSFTGTPTAPTPTAGDNSSKLATTNFIATALASYVPFSGGTMTGPLTISETASVYNLTLTNTNVNGAGLLFNGNGGTTPSKTLRVRSGEVEWVNSANSVIISSLTDAGAYTAATSVNSPIGNFSSNLIAGGSFTYGGTVQPHIFVQSATPTAIAIGDLWFF
jgi:hypothetical protein